MFTVQTVLKLQPFSSPLSKTNNIGFTLSGLPKGNDLRVRFENGTFGKDCTALSVDEGDISEGYIIPSNDATDISGVLDLSVPSHAENSVISIYANIESFVSGSWRLIDISAFAFQIENPKAATAIDKVNVQPSFVSAEEKATISIQTDPNSHLRVYINGKQFIIRSNFDGEGRMSFRGMDVLDGSNVDSSDVQKFPVTFTKPSDDHKVIYEAGSPVHYIPQSLSVLQSTNNIETPECAILDSDPGPGLQIRAIEDNCFEGAVVGDLSIFDSASNYVNSLVGFCGNLNESTPDPLQSSGVCRITNSVDTTSLPNGSALIAYSSAYNPSVDGGDLSRDLVLASRILVSQTSTSLKYAGNPVRTGTLLEPPTYHHTINFSGLTSGDEVGVLFKIDGGVLIEIRYEFTGDTTADLFAFAEKINGDRRISSEKIKARSNSGSIDLYSEETRFSISKNLVTGNPDVTVELDSNTTVELFVPFGGFSDVGNTILFLNPKLGAQYYTIAQRESPNIIKIEIEEGVNNGYGPTINQDFYCEKFIIIDTDSNNPVDIGITSVNPLPYIKDTLQREVPSVFPSIVSRKDYENGDIFAYCVCQAIVDNVYQLFYFGFKIGDSIDQDLEWTQITFDGENKNAKIDIDKGGNLHIVWESDRMGSTQTYYGVLGPNSRSIINQTIMSVVDKEPESNLINSMVSVSSPDSITESIHRILDGTDSTSGMASATTNESFAVAGIPSINTAMYGTVLDKDEEGRDFTGLEEQLSYQVSFDFNIGMLSSTTDPVVIDAKTDSDIDILWDNWKSQFSVIKNHRYEIDNNRFTIDRYDSYFEKIIPICGSYNLGSFDSSTVSGGNPVPGIANNVSDPNVSDEYVLDSTVIETGHEGNIRHFMLALMPEKVRFKALNTEPLFGFLDRNELTVENSGQYVPQIENTYYTGRFKLALVLATSENESTGVVSKKSFHVIRQFGDYITFPDNDTFQNIKLAIHYGKQPDEAILNRTKFDRSAREQDYRFYGDIMVLVNDSVKLGQSFIADFSDLRRRFDIGFGLPSGSQFITNEQLPYNGNEYDSLPVVIRYNNVSIGPHSVLVSDNAFASSFDRSVSQMVKTESINDLLINGSFDSITEPIQPILGLTDGETAISSWTAGFASSPSNSNAVALNLYHEDETLASSGFVPFNGEYFIELKGEDDSNLGKISQDVSTVIGRDYMLQFVVGMNPATSEASNSNAQRELKVSAAASSQNFVILQLTSQQSDPRWRTAEFAFTATSTTTTIEFENVSNVGSLFSEYGPLVDNVKLYESNSIPNELESQSVSDMLGIDSSEYLINYSLGSSTGFSQIPITLSNTDQNINPDLFVDDLDKAHVVWQSNRDNYWNVYYAGSRDRGIPFRFDTKITDSKSNSLMPSISVDDKGVRFVAWHDNRDGRSYQLYSAISREEDPQWVDQCKIDEIEEFIHSRKENLDPYDPYIDFEIDDLGCKIIFDFDVVESGIFHFTLEFYSDKNYTQLYKVLRSKNNSSGWFINDSPLSNEGYLAEAGSSSTVVYTPSMEDSLEDRLLYVRAVYSATSSSDDNLESYTGDIEFVNPAGGTDLNTSSYESDNVRIFSEGIKSATFDQSPISSSASLEISDEGTLSGFETGDSLHSYFVHFDPVGTDGGSADFTITFDSPIVALYFSSNDLDETEPLFGRGDLIYGNSISVGDSIVISDDRKTITSNLTTVSTNADSFRVVVAPISDQVGDSNFVYYCPFDQSPRCSIPYEFVNSTGSRDNIHFRITFYADPEFSSTILSSFSLLEPKNWFIGGGNDFPREGISVSEATSIGLSYDPNILPFDLFNSQKGDSNPNVISSLFSKNNDGWKKTDTTNGLIDSVWSLESGEGSLVNTDTDADTSDDDFWVAPFKFLGNIEKYYGGTLRLRYRLSTDYTPGSAKSPTYYISGGAGTLAIDSTDIPDRVSSYTSIEVPITASSSVSFEPSSGGGFSLATEANIKSVLRNVTEIRIPADFYDSEDEIYLSEISLLPSEDLVSVNDRALLCGVPYYYKLESYDNEIFTVLEESSFTCPCFYTESGIWREDKDSSNWISSGQGFDDIKITNTGKEAINAKVISGQTGIFYVSWEDYRYTRTQDSQPALSPDYFFAIYDANVDKLYSSAQGGFDRRMTYYAEDETGMLYNSSIFLDQFQNINVAFHNGSKIYHKSCSVGCELETFNPELIQPCMFTDGTLDDFYQVGGSPDREIDQYQVIRVREPYISYSTYSDIETPIPVVNDCFIELDIVGVPGTYAYRLRNEDEDTWTDWLPIGASLPEQPSDDEDTRNQQEFFKAFFISRDRFIAPWVSSSGNGSKRVYCEILTFFGKTESFYVDFIASYKGLDYQIDLFFDEAFTQPIPKYRNYPVASTNRTETLITDEYLSSVSEETISVDTIWAKVVFPDTEKLQIIERLSGLERFSDESFSISVYQQGINDQLEIPLVKVSTGIYKSSFSIAEDDTVVNIDGLSVIIVNIPGQCRPFTINEANSSSSPFGQISLDQTVSVFNNMTLFRDTYSGDDIRNSFGNPSYYKSVKFGSPNVDKSSGGGNSDWIGGGDGPID